MAESQVPTLPSYADPISESKSTSVRTVTSPLDKWSEPAMDLLEEVYDILRVNLPTQKLVETHFARLGNGDVNEKEAMFMIVHDYLNEAANRAKEKIQSLLDLERNPMTLDTRVLSDLKEVGMLARATNLPKLLPPDPKEAALNISANIRAYFQVAHKYFVDMVIDHEILLGAQQRIDNALQEELQITAPRDSSKDAKAPRCASGIEAAYETAVRIGHFLQALLDLKPRGKTPMITVEHKNKQGTTRVMMFGRKALTTSFDDAMKNLKYDLGLVQRGYYSSGVIVTVTGALFYNEDGTVQTEPMLMSQESWADLMPQVHKIFVRST
ncbi:hypothetical protein V8E55_007934 [Tylopilus felleus]